MKYKEINKLSNDELNKKINSLKKDLFNFTIFEKILISYESDILRQRSYY